jgi:hypothetical protein
LGKKACLWVRGPFELSKNLGPTRWPNTRKRDESKEIRVSMKVEEGGVHRKK